MIKKLLSIIVLSAFSLTAMADSKKISELDSHAAASWLTTDIFPMVDSATGETKKTSVLDFDTRYFKLAGTLATSKGGTGINSTATFPSSGIVAVVPSAGVVKSDGSVLSTANINLASETTGVLAIGNGGTGQSGIVQAGNFLYSNGTSYQAGTLAGGTGISISDVAGVLTISGASTLSFTPPLYQTGTTVALDGTVGIDHGGTGRVSVASAGKFLVSNGSSYVDGTIAAGSNITVSNVAGTYTISGNASGVTSLEQGSGVSLNPSTITGVGTISANIGATAPIISNGSSVSLGTVGIDHGGTGVTSLSSGVIHSTGSVLASSNVIANTEISGTLAAANGGTGLTARVGQGKFLYDNGSAYTGGTLVGGTGITVSDSSGVITITAAGGTGTVTSIQSGAGITNNPSTITGIGTVAISPGSKGRIISSDGTTATDQAVGTFGQQLVANTNTTTGLEYRSPLYKNYVTNPSCGTLGVSGITVTTGTIAQNTSSPLDSLTDCAISATATGGKYCWAINTFDNALTSIAKNCEAKFDYTGTATAFKAYVSINGTTQTASLRGTLDTSGIYDLNFPCSSGTALMCVEATAATSAIKVANVYVGPQTNVGSVSVVTDYQSYTPTLSGFGTTSGLDFYWRQNGDQIEGYGSVTSGTTSGTLTISLPNGFVVNSNKVSSSTWRVAGDSFDSATASRLNLLMRGGDNFVSIGYGGSVGATAPYGSGGDNASLYKFRFYGIPVNGLTATSNAVRSDQTNFGPTNYGTISISATTTAPTRGTTAIDSTYVERKGSYAYITWAMQQTSAGTAGSGTYLLNVPGGFAIDTTITGTTSTAANASSSKEASRVVGVGYIGLDSSSNGPIFCYVYNSTQIACMADAVFTTASYWGSSLYSLSNAAVGLSVTVKVPIIGWSETQNAPVQVGGITNGGTSSLRIESARITAAGVVTEVNGADWINGNCSLSTSTFTCTLTSGYFTSAPVCTISTTNDPAVAGSLAQITTESTTQVIYKTAQPGVGLFAFPVNITCIGQRN
jgi:hypothetical protein